MSAHLVGCAIEGGVGQIVYLDGPHFHHGASGDITFGIEIWRVLLDVGKEFRPGSDLRGKPVARPVFGDYAQRCHRCMAQPRCILQDDVENRGFIVTRATDDAENFAQSGFARRFCCGLARRQFVCIRVVRHAASPSGICPQPEE